MAGTTEQGAQAQRALSATEIVNQIIVPQRIATEGQDAPTTIAQRSRGNTSKFVGNSGEEVGGLPSDPTPATNTTQVKSVTEELPISFDFKDNPLTFFDNVQYNLRLYMSSETTTHESLPFDDVIVIAETGSTGFNIIDLQMDTIISPSKATKNSFATNVVVKIIEPFGSSLLDYIRNSAAELGVKDHRRVPIWLDIRFKGYTEGFDESFQGGLPHTLDDQTRTWQLRVKNVDIEMTKGGTEYTMNLIAQNESAMEDSARLLESEIHIDAVTLGDFFLSLSIRLNKFTNYSTVIREDKTENIRRYRFALPGDSIQVPQKSTDTDKQSKTAKEATDKLPPMSTWAIRGNTTKKSVKTAAFKKPAKFARQQDDDGGNSWRVTFKKGTSIESIIQQMIGSTDEGQSLLLFGEPNKKISSNKNRNPAIPSIAFTVDPTVFLLSYNKIAKAYNIEITYNIRPYKTFIPTVTREHIEAAQSKKLSKERLKAKNKISKIQKIYNYMFTGENTEVLDYKVELNSTWFISLPIFRGQDRAANAIQGRNDGKDDPKRRGQAEQVKEAKVKSLAESIQDLRKKIKSDLDEAIANELGEEASNAEIASVTRIFTAIRQAEIDELRNLELQAKTQSQIPLGSGLNAVNTASHGIQQKRISITTDAVLPGTATGNIPATTEVIGSTIKNDKIRSNRRASNTNKNGPNLGSIFFAEDFDKFIGQEKNNKTIDENGNITNIGSQVAPSASTGESNVEGSTEADRSFFSVAMNQIYGFKGQLITLDLEIRGDPYWLGEPNIFKRLTGGSPSGFEDLTKADSLIVLTFKFPVGIDDGGNEGRDQSYNGTGLYDLTRRENGFNGVYYITKVENSFTGGRFTQRLTGYIDPLTKEQDLLGGLESNGV